jgi:outer membrane receptor protein involved in Fe transport
VITRANPAAPVLADTLRPKAERTVSNMAPFARVQVQFSKDFRVSVEGRYNREEIELGGGSLGTATVTTGACVAGQPCFLRGTQTFTDFSPRITADFKPGKDSLVYAQFAHGSKSGGFNENAGLPAANFTYKGEKVKSVELGFKSSFMGNRMGLSAALFRNDIEDLQLSNISTVTNPITGAAATTTIVNNVGKARTQGLELDFSARVTDWLTANLNYAYTDAKSREGTEITNGTVFGGNMSVAGFTLPRTPKQSGAASLAVDAPLGSGAIRAFGRVDVVHQGRRYAEIQNMIWADPFTKVNVSTGVRGKDWRVTLWVKNATNETASNNGFRYLDPVTFRRSAVDFLPRLRQYGLTANYDF